MAYRNPLTGDDTTAAETGNTDAEHSSRRPGRPRRRSKRVLATVYDATAGRVTYDKTLRPAGLDPPSPSASEPSRPASLPLPRRSTVRLAPEDVLFRRKDAPVRYAEHDIYRAHERDLPRAGRGVLPPSELLRAVNAYAGRFYGARRQGREGNVREGGAGVDECSMDETALLAFGILLEEAARDALGRSGHLVFTEPQDDEDDDEDWDEDAQGMQEASEGKQRRQRPAGGAGGIVPLGDGAGMESRRKRRKLD